MQYLTKTFGLVVIILLIMVSILPVVTDARITSSARREISSLSRKDAVDDLKIPVLFGIKVSNLYDSWGDGRSGGRLHEGIDILAPRGSLIVSPTDAVVTRVDNGGNGGKNVSTSNPGGERYYYAHLDDYADDLEEGDILKAGDLIGYVGDSGNARGGPTHLHFGVYERRGGATNPFPRLTREFTLKERGEAIEQILDEERNPKEIAENLVSYYKSTLLEIAAADIELPKALLDVLGETQKSAIEVVGIGRVLKIGMVGDDVKLLQAVLGVPADGDFGPRTRAALIEFQIKKGLTGDGVLGPQTRALLALGNLPAGCTPTTLFSATTGVRCSLGT